VTCQKLAACWAASYRRVSRVLRQTVRASSAVEGMNSVLRMHQSRHRTMTQELLGRFPKSGGGSWVSIASPLVCL
jgi:hypothetical protein